MLPLVSVIIPNYNHAEFLQQRIQSVLAQSYENYEVIILDDGSSDDSVSIINRYSSNPHVSRIIINEHNSGSPFIQWRRGMDFARGELIWIAESDDYCDEDFLSTLALFFVDMPDCAIAFSHSEYVDSGGNILPGYDDFSNDVDVYDGNDFICRRLVKGCAIWNASAVIFRKSYALSVDESYLEYKMAGDKMFWTELSECGKVVHVNKSMNYFRQHLQKVSPRRIFDGTLYREEYQIYQYQRSHHHISLLQAPSVKDYYSRKILEGDFATPDIRQSLLTLWGMDNPLKRMAVRLYSLIASRIGT